MCNFIIRSLLVIVALVITLVILLCFITYYQDRNVWTLERVEKAITKNLLQGATKEKTHSWLSENGWPYYHFTIETNELDQWSGRTIAEHALVDKSQIHSWTRVTIESGSKGLIWPKRIVIYFLFDKDSFLIKHFTLEEQVMS